ncbi:hypothetical protein T4E_9948, partial [Trichinella pseudospiralis]
LVEGDQLIQAKYNLVRLQPVQAGRLMILMCRCSSDVEDTRQQPTHHATHKPTILIGQSDMEAPMRCDRSVKRRTVINFWPFLVETCSRLDVNCVRLIISPALKRRREYEF